MKEGENSNQVIHYMAHHLNNFLLVAINIWKTILEKGTETRLMKRNKTILENPPYLEPSQLDKDDSGLRYASTQVVLPAPPS